MNIGNETPPTHNNRSRGAGGVWAECGYLDSCAKEGNIEAFKQHLDAGTDVNAKNEFKLTPLHRAASRGHKEIAELLIAKGADVNAKDDNKWTPLHHAVPDGHKEIAELLIAKGGNVNAKGIYGTPLDHAEAEWEGDVDEVNAARNEVADLLRKHGGKRSKINLAAVLEILKA
ncbi:MAG: ankyrin repeat domain-containing protein [Verrucomicrobia bacterium]|nr:ankyrin repeat domain-containing protein [Verrucomicrobiota bacterium]